jgi:hypothetical protein
MSEDNSAIPEETTAADPAAEPKPAAEPEPAVQAAPEAVPEPVPERQDAGVAAVLASEDWIKHIPSEHVKTAGKYKTLGDFLKGNAELVRKLDTALFRPGRDASEEEWARFYGKLGRPTAPGGYSAPDFEGVSFGDEETTAFFEIAHQTGLTQPQVEALMTWQADNLKRTRAQVESAHTKAHKALSDEWGGEAAGNYETVRRTALAAFGGEAGLRDIGLDPGDPKSWPAPVVSAMLRHAPSFAESPFHHRGARDVGRSSEELIEERDALMSSADYWESDKKQARAREISEALYGTAPAN